MSDDYDVPRATSKLGGLFTYGRTPDPDAEATARRTLATAKIDREIRRAMEAGPALDPAQVGHLVGLLLSWHGSDGADVQRLARAVREGTYSMQRHLTNDDRLAIARVVLGGSR